jgi:hypothetical protein
MYDYLTWNNFIVNLCFTIDDHHRVQNCACGGRNGDDRYIMQIVLYYCDGQEVRVGDKVSNGYESALFVQAILQPNTQAATEYACKETRGNQ